MSETPSRLILDHLVLENFKSYAGRHAVGPFLASFSCVLGANGSGKSNVIDSLLFVFGWRAKALRHARLADLIHTSAEHPDATQARVDVHFALWNDTMKIQVPGSQFVISRVVRRQSSASHYEIDGMKVSQADILERLRAYGMDLSSHRFLILQGEVEMISMLKARSPEPLLDAQVQACLKHLQQRQNGAPETLLNLDNTSASGDTGLLEFLEVIIGSNVHIPSIAMATAEAQLLEQNRAVARSRLKTATAYCEELTERHSAAVDGLKQLVASFSALARHTQVQIFRRRADFEALTNDLGCAQQSLEAATAKHSGCKRERDALREQISELQAKKQAAVDQEGALQSRLRSLEVEARLLDERVTYMRAELKKTQEESALLSTEISTCQYEAETQPAVLAELSGRLAAQEKIVNELRAALLEVSGSESQTSEEMLRQLTEQIAPLQQRLGELQSILSTFDRTNMNRANELLELAVSAGARASLACRGLETARSMATALAQTGTQIDTVSTRLADIEGRRKKLRDLYTELNRLKSTISLLELERTDALNIEESTSHASKLELALLDAQRRGELSGIRGRLGDLASVAPKLRLSAVCAFGPGLDSIVVDDMASAKKALDFIRKHSLGVAHLINLEQATVRAQSRMLPTSSFQAPKDSQRFLDLIILTDESLRPAVWQVVGDTLLCADVAAAQRAIRASDKPRRTVTLDGEVFEANGVITGGGSKEAMLARYRGFSATIAGMNQQNPAGAREGNNSRLQALQEQYSAIETEISRVQQSLGAEDIASLEALQASATQAQQQQRSAFELLRSELQQTFLAIQRLASAGVLASCEVVVSPSLLAECATLHSIVTGLNISAASTVATALESAVRQAPTLTHLGSTVIALASQHSDLSAITSPALLFKHLSSTLLQLSLAEMPPEPTPTQRIAAIVSLLTADSFLSNILTFKTDPLNANGTFNDLNMDQVRQEAVALEREIKYCEVQAKDIRERGLGKGKNSELRDRLDVETRTLLELQKEQKQLERATRAVLPRIERLQAQLADSNAQKARLTCEIDNREQEREQLKVQALRIKEEDLPLAQRETVSLDHVYKELAAQGNEANDRLQTLEQVVAEAAARVEEARSAQLAVETELRGAERQYRRHLQSIQATGSILALTVFDFEAENIGLRTQSAEYLLNARNREELRDLCTFVQPELDSETGEQVLQLYGNITIDKKTLKHAETGMNLDEATCLLREYRERQREVFTRQAECQTLSESYDEARTRLNTLRDQRAAQFMAGFTEINVHLREMYKLLTLGGDAQLELLNQFDPFDGVLFSVMPPRKSWKQICNLSGGEKTISSLSLIFALHCFRPTPFYVMDEIDAALDARNVTVIANYIREKTRNAQFVVISLRNHTFELADRLVGIYKQHNASRCVICDPARILAQARAELK
ncbi:SMC4-like protein [Giardia muris]|uniref:Structural maintenance of chromosomes protein n=1 Tax=Giardia muris TaxID=5742 RepID=A0A4Z1SLB6_GIAMU|nr:SMC4-like protein [Giardia muris]|eukprot:TNJ26434.1 SMC4-like protein [Giardia muris]